jgi:hypothetical protein
MTSLRPPRRRPLLLAALLLCACGGGAAAPHRPLPSAAGGTGGTAGAPAPGAAEEPRPADAAPSSSSPDPADAVPAPPSPSALDGAASSPPPAASGADGLDQMLLSRAVGLGYYHSCLITPTHEVKCFGNMAMDDPRVHPPGNLRAEQIAGAHNGFCVIPVGQTATLAPLPPGTAALSITTKHLTCWGHKDTFFPPANLDMDPVQVGIGYDHGCVLNADHSVVCWGQPGTSNKAPDGLRAKALAVASFFNCAIKDDDGVACWGINPPAPPPGLKARIIAVTYHGNNKLPDAASGTNHACAIKLDGTVACWGTEVAGNLTVPPDLGPARDIAVATSDSCALRQDGSPICWGTSRYSSDPTRYHPMPAGLHLKALRAKLATYCGITIEDDTIVCWGDEQHDHITFPAGGVKLYVP